MTDATRTEWTSPSGEVFPALPRTWRGVTNITERWALAHGWTRREVPVPAPPPPERRFSQYALHLALERIGLWECFWGALTDAQRQYWYEARGLSADDPNFVAALEAARAAFPEADVDAILAEAEE